MRSPSPPSIKTAVVLALFALTAATGCSEAPADDNDQNQENQNQQEETGFQECEGDSWDCAEFVGGSALSADRFGHEAIAIDDERVLLISGSERRELGVGRTDTWEVFNVEEDEVEIEATEFEEPRRDPSVIRLDNGSILLVGGDDGDDQLRSVLHFSPNSLEFVDLETDMNAGYQTAIPLDDGRILALAVSHSFEPVRVVGQVYDADALEWSSVSSGDLLHDRVNDYEFKQLSDGRILFVYSHRAPESDQLPPPDDEDMPDPPTIYERTAVAYDFESGEVEELQQFDEQTFGYDFELVELSHTDEMLMHIVTTDADDYDLIADEAIGLLFDPDTDEFQEQYRRDLDPNQEMEFVHKLPDDQLVFHYGSPLQIHDLDTGDWYDFIQMPDNTRYTSMVTMPDCRLFASGDRPYNPDDEQDDERIHTGVCHPAE